MAKGCKNRLTMEGKHLGSRHKYLNFQVNKIIEKKEDFNSVVSESGDSDVEQMFKIDIANNYKNVGFILEVLKSEDMLLVSRAIKNISWLITDEKHASIINPEYLHSELFPYMTMKAICKFMFHIRITLKDEKRVDGFYKYIAAVDTKRAIKWLPYCSLAVIEQVMDERNTDIEPAMFQRLCDRSFVVFERFFQKNENEWLCKSYFEATTKNILLTETKKYLDTLEKFNTWYWPKFGKRLTTFLMVKCPDRIIKKLHKFQQVINMSILAKHIAPDNAKDLIISLSKNKKLENWFSYYNIKPLIERMPKEGKFEFLKSVFIDKAPIEENNISADSLGGYGMRESLKSENIYQWYRHAQFHVAFPDLKKLVKQESSPEERSAILKVMVTTAHGDMKNIYKVLQYYHDKHINEVFKYKINFINTIVSDTKTHRYDESSWKILDELFHSAEVYIESDKKVQNCIESIFIYNILHKQSIPEIIEKKFKFNSLKHIIKKLDGDEKDEIFTYFYNYIELKMMNQSLKDEADAHKLLLYILDTLNLLLDWKKDISNFPTVLNKIKQLATFNHQKEIDINLECIYNKNKCWKKALFEESLILTRHEDVYLNALKHDPELFERYPIEVEATRCDDKVFLWRVLSKLAIYWDDSLARNWADAYRNNMKSNESKGHKALARGLCGILPREELLELFTKYAPDTDKIIWSEIDEKLLSYRKNFGEIMYMVKPQPPIDSILLYAVGDYLQFTLPTLNSVFYNISSNKGRKYVSRLLQGNISLQKFGVRVAFSKLKSNEVKQVFLDLWKTTKNVSVRAEIFKQTFDLFCKEKNESKVTELWELINMFIDNLTSEENPLVYKLLGSADKVPKCIRAQFCMKSMTFLKTLPAKCNCQQLIEDVALSTATVMDTMDSDFVADMLLEFYDTWIVKTKINNIEVTLNNIVIKYVLSVTAEAEQGKRFERVVRPLFTKLLSKWDELHQNEYVFGNYFESIIKSLLKEVVVNFCENKYLNPMFIFIEIIKLIDINLPLVRNYYTTTYCKLSIAYMECFEKIKTRLDPPEQGESTENQKIRYRKMWETIVPLYVQKVIDLLKEDVGKLSPLALFLLRDPLTDIIHDFVSEREHLVFEKELLKNMDTLVYILAVEILPEEFYEREKNKKLKVIVNLIMEHESDEVKMHCLRKFKNRLHSHDDEDSDDDCHDADDYDDGNEV